MKDAIIRAGKGRSLGSLFICTASDLLLLSFLKKKKKKDASKVESWQLLAQVVSI